MSTFDPTPPRTTNRQIHTSSTGVEQNALRTYAAILRRRWIWIAIGVVVGLVGGLASTLAIKDVRDPNHYYKATNTLIVNGFASGTGSPSAPNLQQAAYLVHSADVTTAVGTELNMDPQFVNDRVSAVAKSDVLSIDVTAISMDPAQAVLLADTTAGILNNYISDDQKQAFAAARDQVLADLDALKLQKADLERVINSTPGGAELERAELDSVVNQYRLKYEELAGLAQQGGPVGGMSTLQTAVPIEINGAGYNARLNENVNARGGPATSAAVTTSGASETSLGGGPPVSKSMRVILGGVAGLMMGLAGAFLVEAWDDRVRRRDRVEALTGLPVIAEVPKLKKAQRGGTDVIVVDSPRSNAAERYRAVRTAIMFALAERAGDGGIGDDAIDWGGRGAPVILFGSPNPSEGKTTTVSNVAAVFGSGGMRTLVIDCDYHKATIAKYLAPVPDLDDPGAPAATRLPGVWFASAPRGSLDGSLTPAETVLEIRRKIAQWRDQFDIILLDTPPILSTNDASDLIPAADTVVVVLRAGQSRSGAAERVSNVLARYQADVLGVVFNGVDNAEMDSYYGYYYGYNDESRVRGKETAPRRDVPATNGSSNGHRGEDPGRPTEQNEPAAAD